LRTLPTELIITKHITSRPRCEIFQNMSYCFCSWFKRAKAGSKWTVSAAAWMDQYSVYV